jgi:hypothetical protein
VAAPLTKAESKYGNGAMVSQEFKPITSAENNPVNVHHIRDAKHKAATSIPVRAG